MSIFNLPGVPALLSPLNFSLPQIASVGLIDFGAPAVRSWGVWNQAGNAPGGAKTTKALNPDSIVSIDYKAESHISNAPMEQGAFQAYNKVQEPSHVTLLLTKGGSDLDRQGFLSDIDTLQKGLQLLTIQCPEENYYDMNLERYLYRRTATEGFTLLQVEAYFVRVRITVQSAFSNTAASSGAATQATNPIPQTPNDSTIDQVATNFQAVPQTAQMFNSSGQSSDGDIDADSAAP